MKHDTAFDPRPEHHRTMRRPRPNPAKVKPGGVSEDARAALALLAHYEGSAQHKDTPSFVAPVPAPRSGAMSLDDAEADDVESPDCTLCPRRWARRKPAATKVLQEAIRRGTMSGDAAPGILPKRVWARDPEEPDIVYEARRLSWPATGYKAFPLTPSQARVIPVVLP